MSTKISCKSYNVLLLIAKSHALPAEFTDDPKLGLYSALVIHYSQALLMLPLSSDRFLITCICRSGPANCSVNFGISLD